MTIYESGVGDSLISISGYTNAIYDYLNQESILLQSFAQPYQMIIEACCSQGRYAPLAVLTNKRYLGIDNVDRYIRLASEKQDFFNKSDIQFICGDVNYLTELLHQQSLSNRALIVFPFNAFGIIKSPIAMLGMIRNLQLPTILFGYTNSPFATKCRLDYYKISGFENPNVIIDETGVRVLDHKGLNSTAYSEEYLASLFHITGLDYERQVFGEIGSYYFIKAGRNQF